VSSAVIVGIGRPGIFCGGSERKITLGGFEGRSLADGMIVGIGRARMLASDTKNLREGAVWRAVGRPLCQNRGRVERCVSGYVEIEGDLSGELAVIVELGSC
jgi:hypothetical protein